MKRIGTLLLLSTFAAQTGCMTLTPIGPLAGKMNLGTPTPTKDSNGAKVSAPVDMPAGPMMVTPPSPPLPTLLVTPGEVTPANHNDTIQRLQRELEADRVAMEKMPTTAEVSVVGKR